MTLSGGAKLMLHIVSGNSGLPAELSCLLVSISVERGRCEMGIIGRKEDSIKTGRVSKWPCQYPIPLQGLDLPSLVHMDLFQQNHWCRFELTCLWPTGKKTNDLQTVPHRIQHSHGAATSVVGKRIGLNPKLQYCFQETEISTRWDHAFRGTFFNQENLAAPICGSRKTLFQLVREPSSVPMVETY